MTEHDPNQPGEIVNEFTPTNEPEPNPEPSLHHTEDQPENASEEKTARSEDDQGNDSDQAGR
jgi:hypothetical protein